MATRPDQLSTASISTVLLGYAFALGLLRAAASWRLFGGRPDPVATSPPPRPLPRGLLRAWLAVTAVLTAAWVAFLVYVVAKLIETVL
jgi:hypothetical protein